MRVWYMNVMKLTIANNTIRIMKQKVSSSLFFLTFQWTKRKGKEKCQKEEEGKEKQIEKE